MIADDDAIPTCGCNELSCACVNVVGHSGEICSDCMIGEHLVVDDEDYIFGTDHDYQVD